MSLYDIQKDTGADYAPNGTLYEQKSLTIVEVNPDFAQYVEANGGYCPCAVNKTPDTLCPCKDFREQTEPGDCLCGRYKKEEK